MKKKRRCPVCGEPPASRHEPFCSRRCADIDLGRWFAGVYALPSDEPPDDGGEDADP